MAKKLFFLLCLWIIFLNALGEEATPIRLQKVKINLRDQAALLRGAKFYANHCMVCHTMRYMEHDELAKKAGIVLDKMPLKQTEWWLNIVPPDLTLIAKIHSPDWLFTYLISFYRDTSRPTGYNNLVKKDVNMPNVLAPFQGEQALTERGQQLLQKESLRGPVYFQVLELIHAGSMSPQEFDQAMTDLVNFLVYASDPYRLQRIYIGIGVMIFLILFFILMILLNRTYWSKER